MNRRQFLVGLFGAAAVVAAGPVPAVFRQEADKPFKDAVQAAYNAYREIGGDDKGNYAFPTLEYLNEAPWIKVSLPKGFRPLRAESDRIGREAIAKMKSQS